MQSGPQAVTKVQEVLAEKPEMLPGSQNSETSTDVSSSDSESATVERTTSQMAMRTQVQGVVQRLKTHGQEICKLKESVSHLLAHSGDYPPEQEAGSLLQKLQKQARDCGEDVLEDMLLLDKLSGLIPEDRASRKAAIANLDSLLEDVDGIKADLLKIQRVTEQSRKETKQEKSNPNQRHKSKQSSPTGGAMPCVPAALLPTPERHLWESQELPTDFRSKELATHYILTAAVPCLNADDINASLSDDGSVLNVSGLRIPTSREVERMQHNLAERLSRREACKPSNPDELASVAAKAYADMGHGAFGQFSRSFQLPRDVDAERIQVSYDEGVLTVKLPKHVYPAMPRHRGFGGALPSARHVAYDRFPW